MARVKQLVKTARDVTDWLMLADVLEESGQDVPARGVLTEVRQLEMAGQWERAAWRVLMAAGKPRGCCRHGWHVKVCPRAWTKQGGPLVALSVCWKGRGVPVEEASAHCWDWWLWGAGHGWAVLDQRAAPPYRWIEAPAPPEVKQAVTAVVAWALRALLS